MRLLCTSFLLVLLTSFASLNAQTFNSGVIAKKLLDKMAAEPDAFYSIHIVLADRVDLAALDAELSARRALPEERSATVLTMLQTKAASTQGGLVAFLKSTPGVKEETVHSFWIANAVFAQVKKEVVEKLSLRSDVAWIGLNGKLELESFSSSSSRVNATATATVTVPNSVEPGLAAINAPAMWAMGYTGYGRVAFTNDTGVDPAHPSVASRYRGLYVPKEEAWFEIDSITLLPTGNYEPTDCYGHGTHVTGTIMGLDRLTFDTVGVAFNAQWIAAPTIVCSEIGTADNVAAFQWALDPDGDPGTAEDMPDAINNSWWDPELDSSDCFSIYVPVLEALEAAGVAVIFSAGNHGPGDMTISPPHNININEINSFTVGALDANVPNLPIAGFSSRGPSECGGDSSLLIKPEVSAPGVSVRSCVPGNAYAFYNGTSMASPHVSGAILLLKEAFPYLTGKDLKLALYHTCTDLGILGEDNTYGMGIINVEEAFNYLVAQGNVPVSPFVAADVLLVEMNADAFSCDSKVNPKITVENAGTDTVYSFEAVYKAGASSTTYTWTGVLAPLERVSLALPPLTAASGEYEFEVELQNPNGTPDERPLNNRLRRKLRVASRPHLEAHAEGGSPVEVCENTAALLRAEYHGPGEANVTWYDSPSGGSAVGEGIVFATPPLTTPQTFYAEASYKTPVGLEDRTAGSGLYADTIGLGMEFNVYNDLVLSTVKVYVSKTGGRLFKLVSPEGETLFSTVKIFQDTGEVQVNLGWFVPAGQGYKILKEGTKALYHNTSGAVFPYAIEDVIEITGPTDGTSNWYYFYNWEVEFTEPCGRTPVSVDVQPGSSSPGALFLTSADSLVLPDEATVDFTNTSTDNVAEFHWNFGDGDTSILEHPSHTYSAPGIYVVSLVVVSLDGCTGFALDTIVVEQSEVSQVKTIPAGQEHIAVFPNPAQDAFTVHFDFPASQTLMLSLLNTTGGLVKTTKAAFVQKGSLQLEAAELPAGIYFLLVETEGRKTVWKVVKI